MVCLFSICSCCLICYLLHPNPNIQLLTFSGFNVKMPSVPEIYDVLVSSFKKKKKKEPKLSGAVQFVYCGSFILMTVTQGSPEIRTVPVLFQSEVLDFVDPLAR